MTATRSFLSRTAPSLTAEINSAAARWALPVCLTAFKLCPDKLLQKAARAGLLLWIGALNAPMACADLLLEATGSSACMLKPAAAMFAAPFLHFNLQKVQQEWKWQQKLSKKIALLPCWQMRSLLALPPNRGDHMQQESMGRAFVQKLCVRPLAS